MRTIIGSKGEEPALWWHSQCLDKQGRMWKYGRAWLHWPGNSIGDGENDWDIDDDAIFEMTCPASSTWDASRALIAAVERARQRNGGAHWAPADGWPDHCNQVTHERS